MQVEEAQQQTTCITCAGTVMCPIQDQGLRLGMPAGGGDPAAGGGLGGQAELAATIQCYVPHPPAQHSGHLRCAAPPVPSALCSSGRNPVHAPALPPSASPGAAVPCSHAVVAMPACELQSVQGGGVMMAQPSCWGHALQLACCCCAAHPWPCTQRRQAPHHSQLTERHARGQQASRPPAAAPAWGGQ